MPPVSVIRVATLMAVGFGGIVLLAVGLGAAAGRFAAPSRVFPVATLVAAAAAFVGGILAEPVLRRWAARARPLSALALSKAVVTALFTRVMPVTPRTTSRPCLRPCRPAGEVDHEQAVRVELAADIERARQRVRGLDGRDDALGAAQHAERVYRLGVGHGAVLGSPGFHQPDVLRTYAGDMRYLGGVRCDAGQMTGTHPGHLAGLTEAQRDQAMACWAANRDGRQIAAIYQHRPPFRRLVVLWSQSTTRRLNQ